MSEAMNDPKKNEEKAAAEKAELEVSEARGKLEKELYKRAEFLAICRRNGLPDRSNPSSFQCLKEVLSSAEWRIRVLTELKSFTAAGTPPDPPRTTVSADKTARSEDTTFRSLRAVRAPERQGAEQHNALDSNLIENFLSQHLVHWFVKKPKNASDKANSDKTAQGWAEWAQQELLILTDATILEILGRGSLSGQTAVDEFDRSLLAVRRFSTDSTHPNAWDYSVPANLRIRREMSTATAQGRETILWSLLRDKDLALESFAKIFRQRHHIAAWIKRLIENVTTVGFASMLTGDPTGEDNWLFAPDRLLSVIESVKAIQSSDTYGVSMEVVRPILDARRTFLAACAAESMPSEHGAALPKSSPKRPQNIPTLLYSYDLTVLDRAWWNSFCALYASLSSTGECASSEEKFLSKLVQECGRSIHKTRIANLEEMQGSLVGVKIDDARRAPTNPTQPKVTIFGAGIAGLTAAHELAERGFQVLVVEQSRLKDAKSAPSDEPKPGVGGVAATQYFLKDDVHSKFPSPRGARTGSAGEAALPGEHGYRLFPSFYRHVFDTMKRTTIEAGIAGIHPTAFDQLQPTYQQIFARDTKQVALARSKPRSLDSFRREYVQLTEGLGFEKRDITRFFFKLLRYLTACSERREAEYAKVSFMDFIGGPSFYSETFIRAVRAAPQALVAMDSDHGDARTQCNVYLHLLMDQVLGGEYTDSTLRGPTSDSWFKHWEQYLKGRGVTFALGELIAINHNDGLRQSGGPKSAGAGASEGGLELLVDIPYPQEWFRRKDMRELLYQPDYVVIALDAVNAERVTANWDSLGVPSDLRGFASELIERLPPRLDRYEFAFVFKRPVARQLAVDALRSTLARAHDATSDVSDPQLRSVFRSLSRVTGGLAPTQRGLIPEYHVTLWLKDDITPQELRRIEELMRDWVDDRQTVRLVNDFPASSDDVSSVTTLRHPEEHYGLSADDRFQTFTGVQYFFAQDFKLVRGHVYFPDTDWGLSAVSQSQFWTSHLPDPIRGVLSVDVGDCRKPSSYTGKSLLDSSEAEIAVEVWRQVTQALRSSRGTFAPVTNLPLPTPDYFHIDDNLRFSGRDLHVNRTPFLINNAGDWDNRPHCLPWKPGRPRTLDTPQTGTTDVWQAPHGGYRVHNDRVVFCGHYMRTFTRMTTMEAANESARHAVNAILDHMALDGHAQRAGFSASGDYCEIWDIEENELEDLAFFKRVDQMLFKAGKRHMADILQWDSLGDGLHPTPSDPQALMTALGVTAGSDWGVQPGELVAAVNGLVEFAKTATRDLYASPTGAASPVDSLLAFLGLARAQPKK